MTACIHTLSDRETAVADGMCPDCLAADNARLRELLSRVLDHIDSDEGPAAIQLRKEINATLERNK